ncbi:MAG: hypothetical protein ACI3W5_16205 [Faecousia sp.]
MNRTKWKTENDRGELMLEALIVYPITMILLFFILAVFSILFQRWNLQTIANESATRMAQTYRFPTADESTGFVSVEDLVEVGAYRYAFQTEEMQRDVEKRISDYAQWRLAKTTFTKNVTDPVCSAKVIYDSLGRRHVEVEISGEYAVPFGETLAFFGFPGTTTYQVFANAECLDVIDYIHTIDFVEHQTSCKQIKVSFFGLIDSLLSLGTNIANKLTGQ